MSKFISYQLRLLILLMLLSAPKIIFGQYNYENSIIRLIADKNFEKALVLVNQHLEKNKKNPLLLFYKAQCEINLGELNSAIVSATKGLELTAKSDTLNESLLYLRSLAYIESGDFERAIADNEVLAERYPDKINYLITLAYFYGESLQMDLCLNTLSKAYKLDSSHSYVLLNLAYYNAEAGNFESSIKFAKAGLATTTDSVLLASLWNSLGYSKASTGLIEEGFKDIAKSLSYKPENPYAYFNKARIYILVNDIHKACENLDIAYQMGAKALTRDYREEFCN